MIWLRLIPYGATAILTAFLTWQVAGWWHGAELRAAEHSKEQAIAAERETCQKNQQKAQEVSRALQDRLRTINARHADYVSRLLAHEADKLRPAGTPGGHDAAPAGDGLPVTPVEVLGLGAAAERQTSQLIACQDFIKREREK